MSPELLEELLEEQREHSERETEPPPRPRRVPLSDDFQFDTAGYAHRSGLPESVVTDELDAFRAKKGRTPRTPDELDADILLWLHRAKKYRAKVEDRTPNVTRLHGQGELFAPPRLTPEQREAKLAWIDKCGEEHTARQRAIEAAIQARKLTHPDETPEQRSRHARARYA